MKKSVLLIILSVFFILASCGKKKDFSPREINFDRDVCYVCKMGLADQRYSAQLILPDGETLWFDDLGCLVELMDSPEWKDIKGDSGKIYIGDVETGKWIDATKAYYRFGDHTPMGYGYAALSAPNDSTYTFRETLERIRKGLTNREAFLKKKGMMGKKDGEMKCGEGKCGSGKCGGH